MVPTIENPQGDQALAKPAIAARRLKTNSTGAGTIEPRIPPAAPITRNRRDAFQPLGGKNLASGVVPDKSLLRVTD